MIVCLTKRHVGLSQYLGDPEGDEKPFSCRVEADHVVEDTHIDGRLDEEDRQLRQLLGEEVHVCSVHPIEVLPQEYRHLHAEHIDNRDQHVVDVGDQEEECPVDADNSGRGVLLSKENCPQYERYDHGL